jgi:putative protease
LSADFLRQQLGRLGGTGFVCGRVDVSGLVGEVILPVSELNRLRRAAVDGLGKILNESVRQKLPHERRQPAVVLRELLEEVRGQMSADVRISPSGGKSESRNGATRAFAGEFADGRAVEVGVLCRTEEQLAACVMEGVGDVYLDFEDVRRYRAAVVRWGGQGSRLWLATPRIIKAGETGYLKLIAAAGAYGVLVRNLGALEFFRDVKVIMRGDFSLNMANALTAGVLHGCGLECCTVSFDLNGEQILGLARVVPADFLQVVIHQHMPLFHMEHCVFAAFLSNGKDYRDCGRPCERYRVELRDRVGQLHTLGADVGCRNTLFHGRAQSAVDWLERFLGVGLRRLRIDLLNESAAQTRDLVSNYRRFLSGEKRLRAQILNDAIAGMGVAWRAGGVTL